MIEYTEEDLARSGVKTINSKEMFGGSWRHLSSTDTFVFWI